MTMTRFGPDDPEYYTPLAVADPPDDEDDDDEEDDEDQDYCPDCGELLEDCECDDLEIDPDA